MSWKIRQFGLFRIVLSRGRILAFLRSDMSWSLVEFRWISCNPWWLQPIHLFLDSSIINVVFLWWMFQSFGHEPVNQLVSEIDDDLWHRLGYRSWGHSWRVCWAFLIFSSIPWPSWPLWRKTKKAWPNGDQNSERWPKSVTWIIFHHGLEGLIIGMKEIPESKKVWRASVHVFQDCNDVMSFFPVQRCSKVPQRINVYKFLWNINPCCFPFSSALHLVGGLEHVFPNILGISSSQLMNSYFSEG